MPGKTDQIDEFLQSRLDSISPKPPCIALKRASLAKGEGMVECAKLVAAILKRHGFEVQQFETPGNPIIVGRAKGRPSAPCSFTSHYDVQPPEP